MSLLASCTFQNMMVYFQITSLQQPLQYLGERERLGDKLFKAQTLSMWDYFDVILPVPVIMNATNYTIPKASNMSRSKRRVVDKVSFSLSPSSAFPPSLSLVLSSVSIRSKDPGQIKAYLRKVQKERWAPFSSDPILLPLRLKDYILLLLSPAFFFPPWGVPSLWSLKSSRAKMTSSARSVQPDTCLMAMVAQCQLSVMCPYAWILTYTHQHTVPSQLKSPFTSVTLIKE